MSFHQIKRPGLWLAGGVAVLLAGIFGYSAIAGAAQEPGPPPGPPKKPGTDDAKDAATADLAFALSVTAANGILSATASPAVLLYTGPASATIGTAWKSLSTRSRARIWRGELNRTGELKPETAAAAVAAGAGTAQAEAAGRREAEVAEAAAETVAAASKTPQQEAPLMPSPSFRAFGAFGTPQIPKGATNLVKWIVAQLKKAIKGLGQVACKHIDRTIQQLRSKGAKVPKMDGWSCDQKIAFVAALGPYGIATVLAGALAGKLATDTVKEVGRNLAAAQNAVQAISAKLGVKMPTVSLPKISTRIRLRGIGSLQVSSTTRRGY